jgi:hypothetical protein
MRLMGLSRTTFYGSDESLCYPSIAAELLGKLEMFRYRGYSDNDRVSAIEISALKIERRGKQCKSVVFIRDVRCTSIIHSDTKLIVA